MPRHLKGSEDFSVNPMAAFIAAPQWQQCGNNRYKTAPLVILRDKTNGGGFRHVAVQSPQPEALVPNLVVHSQFLRGFPVGEGHHWRTNNN